MLCDGMMRDNTVPYQKVLVVIAARLLVVACFFWPHLVLRFASVAYPAAIFLRLSFAVVLPAVVTTIVSLRANQMRTSMLFYRNI